MKKPLLTACVHLAVLCTFAQSPSGVITPPGAWPLYANPGIFTSLVTPPHAGSPGSPGASGGIRATGAPGSATPSGISIPVMIRVSIDSSFKDLSHVRLEWEVLINGAPGQKGSIPDLPVTPKRPGQFRLPVRIPANTIDEVLLDIRYRIKKPVSPLSAGAASTRSQTPSGKTPGRPPLAPVKESGLATFPPGSLVAFEQFILKKSDPASLSVLPDGELSYGDSSGVFSINAPGNGVSLLFNKQSGFLQHYEVKGVLLLEDSLGLKPDFRNDAHLQLFSTSTASDIVIVKSDYDLPGTFSNLHIRYTINAKGEMLVEQILEKDTALIAAQYTGSGQDTLSNALMLSRFGMQWMLPPGFDSLLYYGQAPEQPREQPYDPPGMAPIGVYRSPGVSTAVRWWQITNRQGKGILVIADSALLSISALRYPDIERSPSQTQLDIDYLPKNPGSTNPQNSPRSPLRKLPWGEYSYSYKVKPVIP